MKTQDSGWLTDWKPRRLGAAALVLVAPILATVAWIGAAPTHAYAQDVFFVLNGAWRVLNGQAPHVDFFSPFGPLIFLVVALGLKLARFDVQGIGYGISLMGMVVAAGVFRLASRRVGAAPALLLTVYLTLLCVTPYPLGMDPARFSHAMSYNRIGYGLLCLVMIEAFSRPSKEHPQNGAAVRSGNPRVSGPFGGADGALCAREGATGRLEWLDGAITGAACVLLLFLKANFFLVAGAFVVLSMVCRRVERNRVGGLAWASLAMGIAFLAYLRGDAASMWGDLRIAANARSGGITWPVLLSASAGHWMDLSRLAMLGWLARGRLLDDFRMLWLPAVFGGSILLGITNNQGPVSPPVDVLVILLAVLVPAQNRMARLLVPLCLVPVLWQAGNDARSIVLAAGEKIHGPAKGEIKTLAAPHLSHLHLYDYVGNTPNDEYTNGRSFVDHINQGIELLEKHSEGGETIVCPELADPFAYALLRPPSRGGFVLLAHGYSYTDTRRPSSERLFGGADLALLPNRTAMTAEDLAHNRRNFFGYIERNFHLIAETEEWRLLRNNRGRP